MDKWYIVLVAMIIYIASIVGFYGLGIREGLEQHTCRPGTPITELSDHKVVCQFADGSVEIRNW